MYYTFKNNRPIFLLNFQKKKLWMRKLNKLVEENGPLRLIAGFFAYGESF